jgi:hypothetical protein
MQYDTHRRKLCVAFIIIMRGLLYLWAVALLKKIMQTYLLAAVRLADPLGIFSFSSRSMHSLLCVCVCVPCVAALR